MDPRTPHSIDAVESLTNLIFAVEAVEELVIVRAFVFVDSRDKDDRVPREVMLG